MITKYCIIDKNGIVLSVHRSPETRKIELSRPKYAGKTHCGQKGIETASVFSVTVEPKVSKGDIVYFDSHHCIRVMNLFGETLSAVHSKEMMDFCVRTGQTSLASAYAQILIKAVDFDDRTLPKECNTTEFFTKIHDLANQGLGILREEIARFEKKQAGYAGIQEVGAVLSDSDAANASSIVIDTGEFKKWLKQAQDSLKTAPCCKNQQLSLRLAFLCGQLEVGLESKALSEAQKAHVTGMLEVLKMASDLQEFIYEENSQLLKTVGGVSMKLIDFYFPSSFATVWCPRKVETFINEARKDCVTKQDIMKKATAFGFEPSWMPLQLQGVPEDHQVFGLSISCEGMGIPLTVLMKAEPPEVHNLGGQA